MKISQKGKKDIYEMNQDELFNVIGLILWKTKDYEIDEFNHFETMHRFKDLIDESIENDRNTFNRNVEYKNSGEVIYTDEKKY